LGLSLVGRGRRRRLDRISCRYAGERHGERGEGDGLAGPGAGRPGGGCLRQPQFPLDLLNPCLDVAAVEGAETLGKELAAGGFEDGDKDLHLALAAVGGWDEVSQ